MSAQDLQSKDEISSAALSPGSISFFAGGNLALKITPDGRMVVGEGFTADHAAIEVADLIARHFMEGEASTLRSQNAALTARVEQLNKELEALQFGRCDGDDCRALRRLLGL